MAKAEGEGLREAGEYLAGNVRLLDALGLEPGRVSGLEPLGKGEHNRNYVFEADDGRRFVLRVNMVPQPFHDDQVAYEFAALRALEGSGCVPRALYVDSSDAAPGRGVLVETFCDGRELDFDHLRDGELRCVMQLMANVHSVPVAGVSSLFQPKDPLRSLFDECVERYAAYKGTAFEEARYCRWIERFLDETQDAIDAAPSMAAEGHIVNTETLASHFLITDEAAASAAASEADGAYCDRPGMFVDWERPVIGEVAQDLAFFVAPTTTFWDSDFLFPRSDIAGFVEGYWQAVDGRFSRDGFDARFWAYLKASVLRSQTWFCKNAARYAGGGQGHVVQRTFDKWDVYTSDEFNDMLLRECFA